MCFVIPDWGLQFRAAHDGDAITCELAAVLALIRFAESNPKVFEDGRIEILTDSMLVVDSILGRASLDETRTSQIVQIRAIRERTGFEINWIPTAQNRAIEGILDLPPLKTKYKIDHTNAQRLSPRDAAQRRSKV